MRALLLAAGLGTRLRPLTNTVPKCLVPVNGKPLLDIWCELLFDAGIERILINTHWLADAVRAHVEISPWRHRIDLVHEPELLGTGGTIRANESFFKNQPAFVAHADNLTDFKVRAFLQAHETRPSNCVITMLAFETDHPQSCGILDLDRHNVVIGFHEKVAEPPGKLANAAVYILQPEAIADIARMEKNFIDLSTEVIPRYVNRIFAVKTENYHRDIGTIESLKIAEREFRRVGGAK